MHRIFKNPKTIKELASMFDNVYKLLYWMKLRIKRITRDDTICHPEKVLLERKGSDVEFAWLFYEAIKEIGVNGYVITIIGNEKNSVCLFDHGEKFRAMSNRCILSKDIDLMEEAASIIDKDWIRWIEWASINNKLVPVKPHYRSCNYDQEQDTTSYLLRDRLSRVRRHV